MTGNNFQIESASISDRGLSEKRPHNEDSFLELNERGLFVVADGVGGAQAGDVASQMAVEILGEAFINLPKNADAEEIMKIAIQRANEAIYQMSHDLAQLSTMATTIVALHIAGNIATIGHVGDSRLYRLDSKGNLFRETQDHSVVEEEVRAGRMTAEQAVNHPSRNVISRALGADFAVEVDMKTIMIEPNTTFLLCSDGITRHIDDFQLREILLFNDTPASLCRRMKEICYERGAEDNLTAVIAKVTDVVVDNFTKNKTATAEFEESTVATARPATVSEAVVNDSLVEDESPTQPLVMPALSTIDEVSSSMPDSANSEIKTATAKAENETTQTAVQQNPVVEEKVYRAEQNTGSGKLSRLLSSILFLVVGAILGAGLYYFLSSKNPPPEPPKLIEQSSNIEFSSFEGLRRSVDNDPNSYINRNANITQDAEGLYLLGRAYLLTAKYPEAKKSFEDAKNKLAQANQVNSRILANDIALGLAVVDISAAQIRFFNQVNSKNTQPAANSNTNGQ